MKNIQVFLDQITRGDFPMVSTNQKRLMSYSWKIMMMKIAKI